MNETTGDTPAFMMFGRDIRGPLELLIGDPIEGPPPSTSNHIQIEEYRKNLINNLRYAYNIIREHSELEKIKQKTVYDRNTTQRKYYEGDLVWVSIPARQIGDNSISGKLEPSYQGPCRLIKQLTPVTFTVRRLSDNVDMGATSTDRFKPYCEFKRNDEPIPTTPEAQEKINNQATMLPKNTTSTENEISPTDDAQNQPDSANNPIISRRVSSRHRRVPTRYIEN